MGYKVERWRALIFYTTAKGATESEEFGDQSLEDVQWVARYWHRGSIDQIWLMSETISNSKIKNQNRRS